MTTETISILGHKFVKANAEQGYEAYYRVFGKTSEGTQVSFKSDGEPTQLAAIVDIYDKGEQPEWANSPLENGAVVLQFYTSLGAVKHANQFFAEYASLGA